MTLVAKQAHSVFEDYVQYSIEAHNSVKIQSV